MNFTTGEPVIWLHEMRGGYGYIERIPATVVKQGPKRVCIALLKKDGTLVDRYVKPESLKKEKGEAGR